MTSPLSPGAPPAPRWTPWAAALLAGALSLLWLAGSGLAIGLQSVFQH